MAKTNEALLDAADDAVGIELRKVLSYAVLEMAKVKVYYMVDDRVHDVVDIVVYWAIDATHNT